MVISMFYYINFFFVCSFLGYIQETILKTFFFRSMNNGILFGPWIPVYGFGGVVILIVCKYIFKKFKWNKFIKTIACVFTSIVLLTLLELFGGILIEKIFHKVFWDYSDLKFNIGHYIALEISAVWGLFTLLFIYFIGPFIELVIKKIPKWFSILLVFLFIIDVIVTLILV